MNRKPSRTDRGAGWRLLLRQQCCPAALESAFESQEGRSQNIRLPSLDFLHRANMQFNQLGQTLLRHCQAHTLAAYVGTELFQLLILWRIKHATLGRNLKLTTTPYQGVKYTYD